MEAFIDVITQGRISQTLVAVLEAVRERDVSKLSWLFIQPEVYDPFLAEIIRAGRLSALPPAALYVLEYSLNNTPTRKRSDMVTFVMIQAQLALADGDNNPAADRGVSILMHAPCRPDPFEARHVQEVVERVRKQELWPPEHREVLLATFEPWAICLYE